ncbi:hypothetical protein HanIR_Chr09g0432831 [Helianthus annuus]|nr:hypothetical protein HanIR_Chr09g0432831 [Helianthus annuus]
MMVRLRTIWDRGDDVNPNITAINAAYYCTNFQAFDLATCER